MIKTFRDAEIQIDQLKLAVKNIQSTDLSNYITKLDLKKYELSTLGDLIKESVDKQYRSLMGSDIDSTVDGNQIYHNLVHTFNNLVNFKMYGFQVTAKAASGTYIGQTNIFSVFPSWDILSETYRLQFLGKQSSPANLEIVYDPALDKSYISLYSSYGLIFSGNETHFGNIFSGAALTYDLGSSFNLWKRLYVGDIYLSLVNSLPLHTDGSGKIYGANVNLASEVTGILSDTHLGGTGGSISYGSSLTVNSANIQYKDWASANQTATFVTSVTLNTSSIGFSNGLRTS